MNFDKIRAGLLQPGSAPAEGTGDYVFGDYVFGGRVLDQPTVAGFEWDVSGLEPVDLRAGMERVENQGSYGMCVGEAWTTCLELLRTHRGLALQELSPLQLYYAARAEVARVTAGTISDSGTSAFVAASVLTQTGVCLESLWPQTNPVNQQPDDVAVADAARRLVLRYERLAKSYGSLLNPPITQRDLVNDTLIALSAGLPVVFCIALAASFFNVTGPLETHPSQWESTYINAPNSVGAHAMCIVGWKRYNNGRILFIVENSWGPDWGDGGFWGVDADTLRGCAFDSFTPRSFQDVSYETIPLTRYLWKQAVTLDDGRKVFIDTTGPEAQVFRLYQAAFNRAPDEGGLGYWVDVMARGGALIDVATAFGPSAEWQNLYGSLSDTDYVTALYHNALHRDPDPDGLAFHVNSLQQGATRAQVLIGFSESPENQSNTAPTIQRGVVYQPFA